MRGAFLLVGVLFFLSVDSASARAEAERPVVVKARECLRKAMDAARQIEDVPKRQRLLQSIGLDLAAIGDIEKARQIVEEIGDVGRGATILTAISDCQRKRGEIAAAWATLAEARRRRDSVEPPTKQEQVQRTLGDLLIAGELDGAMQVVFQLDEESERSWAKVRIARAHLAAGRRDRAVAILRNVPMPPHESYSWGSKRIDETVCKLYMEAEDYDAALEIARGMPRGYWVRCRMLCDVGACHLRKGNAAAATSVLNEAFDAAKATEPSGDGMAEHTARELEMSMVVSAYVRGGDIEGAVKILKQMPDGYQKAVAANEVAAKQAKVGEQEAAVATLKKAVDMIVGLASDDDRYIDARHLDFVKMHSLIEIAKCQTKIGEKAAAAVTLAKAMPSFEELDGYSVVLPAHSVAELQILLGDRASAKKTLKRAARKVDATEETDDRLSDRRKIAEAQINLGLLESALTTLHAIEFPTDAELDYRGDVAALMAWAGDLAGGYRRAKQIEQQPEYYVRGVAAYHTRNKGPNEALLLATKEADPALRTALYHGIAVGLLESAKVDVPGWSLASTYLWIWNPK